MCINPPKRSNIKTSLSAYWFDGNHKDITADKMSAALKFVATALDYQSLKDIPTERVDTNLLRSGGANKLLLAG